MQKTSNSMFGSVRRFLKPRVLIPVGMTSTYLLATALRSMGIFSAEIYWLQEDLGGDIAVHFYLGFFLTVALNIFRSASTFGLRWQSMLIVVSFLAVEEASQYFIPARTATFEDWVASFAGALAATVVIVSFGFLSSQGLMPRRRRQCQQ